MNNYLLKDLYVGQKECFTFVIDESRMDLFYRITNDANPLHNNKQFAIQNGFDDKIVFGMLTSSFISTFAGVYLPGKHCVIQQVEIKFVNPVYINEKLLFCGEIVEINNQYKRIVIKFLVTNSQNIKKIRGKIYVGVLE